MKDSLVLWDFCQQFIYFFGNYTFASSVNLRVAPILTLHVFPSLLSPRLVHLYPSFHSISICGLPVISQCRFFCKPVGFSEFVEKVLPIHTFPHCVDFWIYIQQTRFGIRYITCGNLCFAFPSIRVLNHLPSPQLFLVSPCGTCSPLFFSGGEKIILVFTSRIRLLPFKTWRQQNFLWFSSVPGWYSNGFNFHFLGII